MYPKSSIAGKKRRLLGFRANRVQRLHPGFFEAPVSRERRPRLRAEREKMWRNLRVSKKDKSGKIIQDIRVNCSES